MIFLKISLIIAAICVGLFVLSLIIYFFNLDMKIAPIIVPFMNKHYDKIKKDKHV